MEVAPNGVSGKLLVLFGQAGDLAGPALAKAWPGEVVVISPRDLSCAGWHLAVGDPAASVLSAAGRHLRPDMIAGVITRIGWVAPDELFWVEASDREYVAAEMSAFMLAFLDQFPCVVLNRPCPMCLAGPLPRPAVWRSEAARAGFALAPPGLVGDWRISVVGGRCLGTADPELARSAETLAGALGAGLLALELAGDAAAPRFVAGHPFVDLTDPAIAAAAVAAIASGAAT